MAIHAEVEFENDICSHLAAHRWLYAEGDADKYDRTRALFPADILSWIKTTQPDAWEALTKTHGATAEQVLLDRIRKQLDDRGTLDVLRHGVDVIGLRRPLALSQFKPAMGMNADIVARYKTNRLRVVRQVCYSVHNENTIDLVLFLNGIPVATAELKSSSAQSVEDAVDEYRSDRLPRPNGQAGAEPLLDFPRGALVHFAVSGAEVRTATRLAGAETVFLPFNQGNRGGAGNPVNPGGRQTAYLWERIWERDSWLEILGRYLIAERDEKKKIKNVIFPRYHQLDGTRQLVTAILREGPRGRYLIQHSAGSGKTNSIAWTAHFLADLHDAHDVKMFDSVVVVSDRTVLDEQLQETIFGFERTAGVVERISDEGGAKSTQLVAALGGKKIVVCTIQTFPYALKAMQDLATTLGKRFAVIADEAHSSQTGVAASKLKDVLSPQEQKDVEDGGEVSNEEIMAATMAGRVGSDLTYIAFTATPKAKTIELFGTLPHPDRPPGADNVPKPFHVYSMRQAIEEGFILDVLKNYTSYKVAYKLATGGDEYDENTVERAAAVNALVRWVKLHPHNIAQKVQIVVEHFRQTVAPLLSGFAKAMVVLSTRKEAVRWKLAIDKYIASQHYGIGTLVAFSGDVNDLESGPEPFTERSHALNPTLNGRNFREAFAGGDFQIMLVANKFQTGFDQPLLCGMYVDKKLAGVQAVQTLSRLNRAHQGKDTTYILDFVNEPEEVLAAFKVYYDTAQLAGVTDPNLIIDLRQKLDGLGYYDSREVEAVVAVVLDPKSTQTKLRDAIAPIVQRLMAQYSAAKTKLTEAQDEEARKTAKNTMDALELFKRDIGTYIRVYAFLSQIINYGNTDLEKRSAFFRVLLPVLEFGREREQLDISKVRLTHHQLRNLGTVRLDLASGEIEKLKPMTAAGGGGVHDPDRAPLREIIARMNDLFGSKLSDNDQLRYFEGIRSKLLESEILIEQAKNNTKEQFSNSPDLKGETENAVMDSQEAHTIMSTQILASADKLEEFKRLLLGPGKLHEMLRQQSMLNTTIFGSGNTIIIGGDGVHSVTNQQNEIEGLVAEAAQLGIGATELDALKTAAAEDRERGKTPDVTDGESQTGKWYTRLFKEGAFKVGTEVLSSFVLKAIETYTK